MEKEEGGVTLGGIFRTIGKKIWIVVAATVVITLIAVLMFALVINPSRTTSSMSFRIEYPTSDSAKYPDGSPFSYRDLISYEVLEEAKASSEAFSSLDVKDLLKEDDISVSVNAAPDGSDAVYTLSIKTSRFKKQETVERYLRAVADTLVARIKTNASELEFGIDAETFHSASFSEQLAFLKSQKQTITDQYNQWISLYTASYRVNGKTLANYLADVTVVYGDSTRTSFEKELANKGFDEIDLNSYETAKEAIDVLIDQLLEEHAFNQKIIDELRKDLAGSGSGDQPTVRAAEGVRATVDSVVDSSTDKETNGSSVIIMPGDLGLSEMLASYLKRNAEIEFQLEIFQTKDSATGAFVANDKPVRDFRAKVNKQFVSLSEAAKTLSAVSKSIYEKDTYASFESQSLNVNGGMSIVIVAVGVFVVAFLVACVIAYFVGSRKKPVAEAAQNETEENTQE